MTIDTHTHGPIEIAKVIKRHKDIAVVKLKEPIYGGIYAVSSSNKLTTGLCLGAANELFGTLKALTR